MRTLLTAAALLILFLTLTAAPAAAQLECGGAAGGSVPEPCPHCDTEIWSVSPDQQQLAELVDFLHTACRELVAITPQWGEVTERCSAVPPAPPAKPCVLAMEVRCYLLVHRPGECPPLPATSPRKPQVAPAPTPRQ